MLASSQIDKDVFAADNGNASFGLIALAGLLAALIFFADMLLPLGVAGGVPYAGVVLIGLWSRWRPFIFVLAGLGSMLTVLGYFYSPAGGEPWVVIVNRGEAILIIWVVAIVALQRKRWESKLRQSEAQMRLVTDALPVLIAYVDTGRRFRFVNATAEDWFAKPRTDIIGRSTTEVVGEAQADRTESVLKRVEDGETIELEFAETYPDGVTRIVKLNVVPDFGADGKVRGHFALFQDVTKRKQAETALRRSQSQIRLLADNLPVMIISLDPELRFRFANKAYCEAHNWEQAEIAGKDLRDVLSKAAYKILKPNIDAVLKGRQVAFEARYTFGDNVERDIEASYVPEIDDQGKVRGFFVTLIDVTEHKQSEERLRDSEAQFRLLNENLPALVASLDTKFHYRFANRAYREWFGLSDRDIVGKHVRTVLGQNTYRHLKPRLEASLGGKKISFETSLKRSDGASRTLAVSYVPDRNEAGAVQGLFLLADDITERKEAEEALLRSEASLANAQHIAHIGSWDWDIATDNLDWSEEIYNIFGTKPQMFGGTYGACISTVHPDDRTLLEEAMNAALEGQAPLNIDHRIVLPTGEVRVVHEQAEVERDAGGKPVTMRGTVQDITERRRAEAALEESEAQFRLIADNIPGLIVYLDADQKYRFVNKTAAKWHARPVEKFIGRRFKYVLGAEQYEKIEPGIRKALHGQTATFDGLISYGDGVTRDIYATYVPHLDARSKVIGIFALVQDITERRRAEEAMKKSEASLANAQRIAHIGSWDWEILAGELHWSDEIYRIFGLTPREFDATFEAFLATVHPDDRTAVEEAVNAALDRHAPYSIEHRIVLPSGEVRVVHERAEIERDADGKPVTMRGTVQDITERKQSESARKESEEALNAFFSNAPVGMALYDPDIRYLKINEQFAWGSDLSVDEHIGRSIAEIKPNAAETLEPIYRDLFESGKTKVNFEVQDVLPSDPGVFHWWSGFAFPTSWANGKPSKIGVVALDITERKRIEDEVRELNADLEQRVEKRTVELRNAQSELVRKERLATLGQISATVSHELRNPLGTIRNSLVVLEKILGGSKPEVQRSLERIARNIGRCNNIIDEMLDFARTHELELKKTAFDDWLGRVLGEFQVPSGVSVGLKLGAPKVRIGIDDERLRRAIVNVYDNACQAMLEEHEGKGPASKKKLTVSTKATKGRLELAIADTGPGMPPEVLNAAFEPLYSTKGFGVGLGLPIVKQIMDQHGGGIEIDSKQGSGTRVVLWLPLEQSTARTKRATKTKRGAK